MSQVLLITAMLVLGVAAPPSQTPETPFLIFALAVLGTVPRLLKP